MKPTGPQVAHSLIEWAERYNGADGHAEGERAAREAVAGTARQLAQEILDNPGTNRLRQLGLLMLGIDRLPDEQWTGPVPSVEYGTDEVSRAIDALSAAWKNTTLHKIVALRTLAWNATQLSRAFEIQQRERHDAMLVHNGGHTAGMLTRSQQPQQQPPTNDGESKP